MCAGKLRYDMISFCSEIPGIILLTSSKIAAKVEVEIPELPPYSPNLAPTDYFHFRVLKKHLSEIKVLFVSHSKIVAENRHNL